MLVKEICEIIIDAENGTLRFEDKSKSMRDFGGIKFIYDQKNDSDLITSFKSAYESMIDELHYDGVHPVFKNNLGIVDTESIEYHLLKGKNGLVNFLKEGSKNSLIINIPMKNKVSFSIGEQLESGKEWSVIEDDNYYHTLVQKLFRFAEKFNERASASESSTSTSSSNEIKKYMARKHTKPTM